MQNADVRNISLGEILYFVKVFECGSLTRAAEYFHLTQPTLSKKLSSLESQTGVQLFIRERNRCLRPTPAGRHLYEQWKGIPPLIEGSVQEAHILQSGYSKTLVVAMMDSFRPEAFVMPAVETFLSKYPDVRLRIESNSAQHVRQMLLQGSADIAFSILYDFERQELEKEYLEWRMFGSCPHCACMLKSSPLAGRESLRMDDLQQMRFVCISPQELPEYLNMIRRLCARHGFRPNISKFVSSASSLTLNITEPDEIFICDRYYRDPGDGRLCYIPLEQTSSGFVLAWRRDSGNSHRDLFLQHCIDLFDKLPRELPGE